MKISPMAVETLHNNINKCGQIAELMYSESTNPDESEQTLQGWSDELIALICLIDDMQGLLMSDLTD